MDKVGLQKNSCKIIDVTNKRGTVESLTEAKISCVIEEKVCNSWADKEAKLFKIQDTIFITFYCWFEPNASTRTPHCLGTWSMEVYQVKSKENYKTYREYSLRTNRPMEFTLFIDYNWVALTD